MGSDSLKIKFFRKLLEVAQYVLQDKRDPEEAGERLQEIIDEKDAAKFESDAEKLKSDTESREADILNRIKVATARGLVKWRIVELMDGRRAMECEINKDTRCLAHVGPRYLLKEKRHDDIIDWLKVSTGGASDRMYLSYDYGKFFYSVFIKVGAEEEDREVQAIQSEFNSLPSA